MRRQTCTLLSVFILLLLALVLYASDDVGTEQKTVPLQHRKPVATGTAQEKVPGSTSPDGAKALYYRTVHSKPGSEAEYEFFLRSTKSLRPVSDQLVPSDDNDLKLLFDLIGTNLEAKRKGLQWDGAFGYSIAWSPDSRWVLIEGGEHKFWHLMVYDRFVPVTLPSNQAFKEYFHKKFAKERMKNIDVSEKILPSPLNKDDRDYAFWIGNGTFAVNAYPYLLREDDYTGEQLYFIVNCKSNPAALVGFGR